MAEVLNTQGNLNNEAPAGHDQAMLDAVAKKEAELLEQGQPKEPEKILGKFNSQEDLVKAYQELEKKLSQPKQEAPKAPATELTEDEANELVVKAGLDLDAVANHYYENGSLAEEHYAALEAAGVSRAYVDQYISGVEAQAQQMRDEIFNEVGGQEAFSAISQWAVANLSAQELAEYNEAVDSGDMATVRSAVMSLAYRYQRSAGREPQLVNGKGGTGGGGFESLAQLTAAMKDPRYSVDPAYRREVEQKLARSSIF